MIMTTMYEKIKDLAAQNRVAKTKEEKERINNSMLQLQEENPEEYGKALEMLIRETSQHIEELSVAEQMGEVTKIVSMSYIAKEYFGKSRSWLFQRLNGNAVNGKPATFTPDELLTLKNALSDIARRIGSISAVL